MFPIYLIALAMSLGAIWVFFKTSQEVYTVLAAAVGIICFIWGFALAPWHLQLLLVVILLVLERLYAMKEGRQG
ncbi:MAG: hypothetical protein KME26_24630 [Oscillatoria princeps RMCB-10]|jgi:MFS superfamily sulfate permease-like transporter|nr:hypothetical protein [Oscillatoria princeps RMCB-10]